jgi:hypothetical protein
MIGLKDALSPRWRAKRSTRKEDEGLKAHSNEWSRAQRRTRRRQGLECALKKMVEGSKAHSKEMKARRRTKKKGEGSNAHSKGGEGSKAHLKVGEGSKAH